MSQAATPTTLPVGYSIIEQERTFRLFRESAVSPTDDGYPDEIEDGFSSFLQAARVAHECAQAH